VEVDNVWNAKAPRKPRQNRLSEGAFVRGDVDMQEVDLTSPSRDPELSQGPGKNERRGKRATWAPCNQPGYLNAPGVPVVDLRDNQVGQSIHAPSLTLPERSRHQHLEWPSRRHLKYLVTPNRLGTISPEMTPNKSGDGENK
jgi:hypothetical protein